MSEGKSPHRRHTDTQEFEAIRPPEGIVERKEFELVGHQLVPVRADFEEPIELRLGHDERTPALYLLRGQSRQGRVRKWAIVQPEVFHKHSDRGWAVFDWRDVMKLGRQVSPQFEFGPDVSRMHCIIAETDARKEGGNAVEIENYGRNGLRVLVHPDDLVGEVEAFTPDKEDTPPE